MFVELVVLVNIVGVDNDDTVAEIVVLTATVDVVLSTELTVETVESLCCWDAGVVPAVLLDCSDVSAEMLIVAWASVTLLSGKVADVDDMDRGDTVELTFPGMAVVGCVVVTVDNVVVEPVSLFSWLVIVVDVLALVLSAKLRVVEAVVGSGNSETSIAKVWVFKTVLVELSMKLLSVLGWV
jgi:hypothetical protein